MGTNLLIPDNLIMEIGDKDALDKLVEKTSYLQSIRVYDGSSQAVKDDETDVSAGDIAISLGQGKYIILGREVNVLNVGSRARAAIITGADQPPINYFDETSDAFKQVWDKAMAKTKNYQAGLEYLVWVPAAERFCCFFLGNASGRFVTKDMRALMGCGVTIRAKFVKKPNRSWWGPEILPCSTPFELPTDQQIAEAHKIFEESRKSATDQVDEETGRER